jgi:hypothetical protein
MEDKNGKRIDQYSYLRMIEGMWEHDVIARIPATSGMCSWKALVAGE